MNALCCGDCRSTEPRSPFRSRLTGQSWTIGSDSFTEAYTYDADDGSLASVSAATGETVTYNYDALKRQTGIQVANGNTVLYQTARSFTPGSGTNQTTPLTHFYNYKTASGSVITGWLYGYDAAGNISQIRESLSPYRVLVSYIYDEQNQLTKETWYTYSGTSTTPSSTKVYTYTYDTAGNLLTSSDGTNTSTYTYGDSDWADLLTAYNGHTIHYSGGNPTNWYNGSELVYTSLYWTQGRKLCAMQYEDSEYQYQMEFEYDMSGIRTKKVTDFGTHDYVTQNGKVVRETFGAKVLDFIYDANGRPFALKYSTNGGSSFTTYYYVLNAQGDVMGLLNSNGTLIAKYSYDAWGKLLSVTNASGTAITSPTNIANINPLRYRGYYYDAETGWYYLQSRYYDPIIKRFLSADSYGSTGQGMIGHNMFAYCNNNPVNRCDPGGSVSSSTDDINKNGIPDYLEKRWVEMTNYYRAVYTQNGNVRDVTKEVDNALSTAIEVANKMLEQVTS